MSLHTDETWEKIRSESKARERRLKATAAFKELGEIGSPEQVLAHEMVKVFGVPIDSNDLRSWLRGDGFRRISVLSHAIHEGVSSDFN